MSCRTLSMIRRRGCLAVLLRLLAGIVELLLPLDDRAIVAEIRDELPMDGIGLGLRLEHLEVELGHGHEFLEVEAVVVMVADVEKRRPWSDWRCRLHWGDVQSWDALAERPGR